MQYNNVELSIRIKDKAITEYAHNGQIFVEGRDSSEFTVQIRNNNPFRVEAIVSVDGLSVIDGKDAGPSSAGYLLEANETLNIPGWKLNDQQVAAFTFAGKKASYAAQSTGSSRNTGVIGLMAFKEKVSYRATLNNFAHLGQLVGGGPSQFYNGNPSYSTCSGMARGMGMSLSSTSYAKGDVGSQGPLGIAASNLESRWTGDATASCSADSATLSSNRSRRIQASVMNVSAAVEAPVVQQTLGTAFGQAQDFATETVEFERGDMLGLIVIYYDDKQGLKARGVPIERRAVRRVPTAPVAFPGASCAPPPGWRG